MKIVDVRLHYIFVPYVAPVGPYWGWKAPSHGAHAVLYEVEASDGTIGWGETAGRESIARHSRTAEAIQGKDFDSIGAAVMALRDGGHTPEAISGLEMGLWDIRGRATGQSLSQMLGGPHRHEVDLCGLMGIKSPADAAETALIYRREFGFRTIKTKAGRALQEDAEIARALYSIPHDDVLFRFDANQNLDIEGLTRLAAVYRDGPVQYVEQPLPDSGLETLAGLRSDLQVPIALNESVTDARSVERIATMRAADYLVPDLPTAGSICEMVRLARMAQQKRLPCAFHCWHDLGVKTAAMAHLVTSLPAFTLPSDTTYHGLENDILTSPMSIREGRIPVPPGPGLGVEVDMARVDEYRKDVIE